MTTAHFSWFLAQKMMSIASLQNGHASAASKPIGSNLISAMVIWSIPTIATAKPAAAALTHFAMMPKPMVPSALV